MLVCENKRIKYFICVHKSMKEKWVCTKTNAFLYFTKIQVKEKE